MLLHKMRNLLTASKSPRCPSRYVCISSKKSKTSLSLNASYSKSMKSFKTRVYGSGCNATSTALTNERKPLTDRDLCCSAISKKRFRPCWALGSKKRSYDGKFVGAFKSWLRSWLPNSLHRSFPTTQLV